MDINRFQDIFKQKEQHDPLANLYELIAMLKQTEDDDRERVNAEL